MIRYVAAQKKLFSMPQNILPQAWMVFHKSTRNGQRKKGSLVYPDSADASVLVEAAYWYSLTDFEQSLSTFQGDISVAFLGSD